MLLNLLYTILYIVFLYILSVLYLDNCKCAFHINLTPISCREYTMYSNAKRLLKHLLNKYEENVR